MSRGQQGIGISAAGMYGLLTTGKPVKIMSKVSKRNPAHYYEIQIDTKHNKPEILNGRGEGVEIPPGDAGAKAIEKHDIEWIDSEHGTRVTIELEGKYQRGRGSVDEYLEQTAIANPHVSIHYTDPDDNKIDYARVAEELPPEPKEIKPHPYGVELGRLVGDAQGHQGPDDRAVSHAFVFACFAGRGPANLRRGRRFPLGQIQNESAGTRPTCSIRPSSRRRFPPRRPIAFRPSARN